MTICILYLQVNLATELFPGVVAAPIVLGTVAATGGKHTFDIIMYHYGMLNAPAEGTVPGYSCRSVSTNQRACRLNHAFVCASMLALAC